MKTIFVKDQRGLPRSFVISGNSPTPSEQARIDEVLSGTYKAQTQEDQPGIVSLLGKGISRGIDSVQAGVYTGLQGLAEQQDDRLFLGKTPEEYAGLADEQRHQRDAIETGIEGGFFDQGPGGMARYLALTAGETLPAMLGGLGAIALGSTLGPVGTAGGIAAAGLMYSPQILNENAERQIEQFGYIKDWEAATKATAASALVESFADRITLGAAGLLKKPVSQLLKKSAKEGTQKALTIAARRIGTTAAVGALSEAPTEVIQSILSRAQAEMPVGDEQAQAEYLEGAVVGGLLGGVFGGVIGTGGAVSEARTRSAERQAEEDAAQEGARLGHARDQFAPQYATAREAAVTEPATPIAGLLTDTPLTEAPVEAQPFSEGEYRDAVEQLRESPIVSADKIKNTLKIGRPKAEAIFREMLRRDEASPAGSKGQYLRIKAPKHDIDREYSVRPVDEVASTPHSIKIGDRILKEKFRTEQEARDFAEAKEITGYEISTDPNQQYGIYEQQYETTPDGRRLIGQRILKTFSSRQEANEAAKGFDPGYSPESNEKRLQAQQEEKNELIQQEIKREFKETQKALNKLATHILGEGRAEVELTPTIDNEYLSSRGVSQQLDPDVVVEGMALPAGQNAVKQLISVANDLIDPNLTPDQRQNKLNEVLTHELVHALRNADLLKRSEWDDLIDYVARQKVPGKNYTWIQRQRARGGPKEAVAEESIAEMLRHYMADPTAFDKKSGGILKRIADFIKKILRLGQNHEAEDIMRAILGGKMANRQIGYGGLGPRNYPGKPFFADVRVPPFYMATDKFFSNLKQEKASADQWMGIVRKGPIKKDELDWLGLEDWLRSQKGQIPRGDVLDFIRANAVELEERIFETTHASKEEEERYTYLGDELNKQLELLQTSFHDSDNYNHYVRLAEDLRMSAVEAGTYEGQSSSPFELWLEDQIAEDNEAAISYREMNNEFNELADKLFGERNRPKHEGTTQEGGFDYKEMLLHIPKLQPKFSVPIHYDGFENVLAGIRFKERRYEGNTKPDGSLKRTLFIEEIQSDLHQRGRKYGYHSPEVDRARAETQEQYDTIEKEVVEAREEYKWIKQQKENAEAQITADPDMANFWAEEVSKHLGQERAAMEKYTEKVERFQALGDRLRRLNEQSTIPDAPVKSSWDEMALKRIIRYAADNEFDEVAWHGDPDSVALTEGYHNMVEEVDPETKEKRYVIRYDDDPSPPDVTGIINFYTRRLRNFASKWGRKFGTSPQLINPRGRPKEYDFNQFFGNMDDVQSFLAVADIDPANESELFKAAQIAANQREWDFNDALAQTGVDPDQLYDAASELEGEKGPTDTDNQGNSLVARWVMPITEELKRTAQEEGFPLFSAVKVPEVGEPQYSATAPMGNRVPSMAPVGTLAEIEFNTLYNNIAPSLQKLGKYLPPKQRYKYEETVEGTFIALQDRMLPVGKLIDRIRKNGGVVSNETDTYLREQLFSGQTDEAIEESKREFYDPLIDSVHKIGANQSDAKRLAKVNEVAREIIDNYSDPNTAIAEAYLYAQHAVERNAEMRKRNKDLKDDRPDEYEAGSGMTDEEAGQILDWINAQPFSDNLSNPNNPESVRSRYRALIRHTNDVRVTGLLNPDFKQISPETGLPYDTYEDYAPLRGWIDEHFDGDNDGDLREFARTGKGYRIRGKEDYSAVGRKRLATDLIAHGILQNEESIVRAGKNRVARSFVNLVRENPDMMKGIAEIISTKRMKYVYDRKSGKVRRAVSQSAQFDPSVLTAKEGAREVHVKIKDPRIAKAMNQRSMLGNTGAGAMMKALLRYNRFLAAMRTSYNPEFMIGNFLRDLEAALVNVSENEIKGLKSEIVRQLPTAIKGVWEGVRNQDVSTDMGKTFREYRKYGGMTAVHGVRELEDTINKMNRRLSEDLSGNVSKSKKAIESVFNFVEDMNLAVENGVRLSTFKTMRDKFLSEAQDPTDPATVKRASERAAFIAKNLTVNFNMGGDVKPMMNAAYLFYNASIQGSMALINPMLRSKKVRRIWATVFAAGLVQDILMSMLSEEDEDGVLQYDKIPDYILEHNLVYMDPFGISERGYFKIPLPYLMNGIYNAGRAAAASARGRYTPVEGAGSIVGTLIDSLNPWAGTNSLLNFVAPTIADPIVDLATNLDFTGAPIAPPENPFGTSEKASQRYWNNTSPPYVFIADWMSKLTGGEGTYLPGAVEYSPNQYEYVFEWFGGGLWTFGQRMNDLVNPVFGEGNLYKIFEEGEEWSANEIPALRRFYGNVTSKNDLQFYIENRDKVLAIRQELKEAVKNGDSAQYTAIISKYPEEYRVATRINKLESLRKKIGRKIKQVQESKTIPEDRKEELVKMLKERQDGIVGQANVYLREIR